jgi:hypothetical protein
MKIGVIGWGSLIWCPGELKICSRWRKDGPSLPLEFSRISTDGRLTLVIIEGISKIKTLWAMSEFEDMDKAAENLCRREGTCISRIGTTKAKKKNGPVHAEITAWLSQSNLDGAVWTALPPKNHVGKELLMTEQEAVEYIKSLSEDKRKRAEQYVRNTPEQVETKIRSQLREVFEWKNNPLSRILFEEQ